MHFAHALALAVTDRALCLVVFHEPLQNMLCVAAMLALLAPYKPHLYVSAKAA
jgi:hypothetical protein